MERARGQEGGYHLVEGSDAPLALHSRGLRGPNKRRAPSYDSLARLAPPAGEAVAGNEGGGGGGSAAPRPAVLVSEDSKTLDEMTMRSCLMREPLLLATLVGVACGITLGLLLKLADPGPQTVALIGYPGELMLRLLKMLVLPMVALSMVSGVCALQQSGSGSGVGRLARLTFAYYAGSTLVAIVLGIVLVQLLQPGRGSPFDSLAGAAAGGCHAAEHAAAPHGEAGSSPSAATAAAAVVHLSTADALMNVGREVLPDNIVRAAVDMNILGVITFCLMLGIALASLGAQAEGVIQAIGVLNAAVGKMVTAALWVSPLGIGSLIAASILKACDLAGTLSALGLWAGTVVLGLALFALVLLPGALYLVTGLSPLRVAGAFAQSLLMAFGTSSSAASLPLAMQAARDLGCEEGTISFFLPLGCTVNMNGTALYEATTAIFIAQAHGVVLGPAELAVVAFTASLAAIGAPAIPSAGLVTMLIVLQAVNLGQYAADLAVILAVDWLLDRIRTAVNLLSDGFGVVMVDSLMTGRHGHHGILAGSGGGGKWAREGGAGSSGSSVAVGYHEERAGEEEEGLRPRSASAGGGEGLTDAGGGYGEGGRLGSHRGGGAGVGLPARRTPAAGHVQLQILHDRP